MLALALLKGAALPQHAKPMSVSLRLTNLLTERITSELTDAGAQRSPDWKPTQPARAFGPVTLFGEFIALRI
jgi:hypothetical protein